MKFRRVKSYWQIWTTITKHKFSETFLNRWTNSLFIIAKSLRFGMLFFFLLMLQRNVQQIAGYTSDQVIIVFLTYQFLDTFAQIFYRGVYSFSYRVREGSLDFYLAKPINPLFRVLMGEPDIMDIVFFIPTTALSTWLMWDVFMTTSVFTLLLYVLLLMNSFIIITSIHVLVLCLGILTTEVDNAIMLYRDFNTLGRFPVDIYREPLRTALFFIVPIGVINTIPAQVLLHLEPSYGLLATFGVGVFFFFFSLRAWAWSIKRYTSAGG